MMTCEGFRRRELRQLAPSVFLLNWLTPCSTSNREERSKSEREEMEDLLGEATLVEDSGFTLELFAHNHLVLPRRESLSKSVLTDGRASEQSGEELISHSGSAKRERGKGVVYRSQPRLNDRDRSLVSLRLFRFPGPDCR